MSLLDVIQMENLDDEQREMAELIGMENYKKLVRHYGGSRPYIPMAGGIAKSYRNESIRKAFNGYNFHELAIQFHLTDVTIRAIVADLVKPIRSKPSDGQISMFDLQ